MPPTITPTVVLDDDPTGTQAASGVTVLLRWDADELTRVLREERSVYLQTNSRAVDAAAAAELARRIRDEVAQASAALGEDVLVVQRGDSTLRGHVVAETDVFVGELGRVLFVPAFPQGGRTTVDGVHTVLVDGVRVPAGETEFAADPVFGFRGSHLVDWVFEKSGRHAVGVPLATLRSSGGSAVADALAGANPHEFVVPDVETDDDVHLVHAGLREAVDRGVPVVVRCAAPLAAACAGRESSGFLERPVPVPGSGVLVVCGSHTGAAGRQLADLSRHLGVEPVVLSTDAAFADPVVAGRELGSRAREVLRENGIVVVASERVRRADDDSLRHGELVMRALVDVVGALATGAGA